MLGVAGVGGVAGMVGVAVMLGVAVGLGVTLTGATNSTSCATSLPLRRWPKMNTRSPRVRALVFMFIRMLPGIDMVPPVMARVPTWLPPTFRNFVPWLTYQSSSLRFEDLMPKGFLAAATTVPRCTARVWAWNRIVSNVRIGVICVSVVRDLLGDLFQPFIADDSACVS